MYVWIIRGLNVSLFLSAGVGFEKFQKTDIFYILQIQLEHK